MNVIKKAISLTIAVIMLFTGTSVLQAADSISLDMAELNELKLDVNKYTKKGVETPYPGIPSLEVIKALYKLARENQDSMLENYAKLETKEQKKARKKYKKKIREEAAKRVYEEKSKYEWAGRTKEEQEQIAYYTILLEELEHADNWENVCNYELQEDMAFGGFCGAMGGMIVGSLIERVLIEKGLFSSRFFPYVTPALTIIGGIIGFVLYTEDKPYYDEVRSNEMIYYKFLDKPFEALVSFDKGGFDDFFAIYNLSADAAQALYDAVSIEYYVSMNPTLQNMRDRLYIQSVDWHGLGALEQAKRLQDLAKRLRSEAN